MYLLFENEKINKINKINKICFALLLYNIIYGGSLVGHAYPLPPTPPASRGLKETKPWPWATSEVRKGVWFK